MRKERKKTEVRPRRLPSKEREAMIVREAIHFFAREGFSANTRDLAKHLGVTQSLIYQYFPTKDELIDRLYRELILDRWKPEWETWVGDRRVPLVDRLVRFYLAFTESIFNYETMRIFFFMWLMGDNPRERYLNKAHRRHFARVCEEIRHDLDLPTGTEVAISETELEMVAGMHGSIVYLGVRLFIFGAPRRMSNEAFIRQQVRVFLRGCGEDVRSLVAAERKAKPRATVARTLVRAS
ncbi:MAG: TetR/AcrR family transcriptional regulator [Alphaproteobacteria bacterium]|nr:TetR/AcrR family transcriptional regulator [Alphaproteobacteria bacterium]